MGRVHRGREPVNLICKMRLTLQVPMSAELFRTITCNFELTQSVEAGALEKRFCGCQRSEVVLNVKIHRLDDVFVSAAQATTLVRFLANVEAMAGQCWLTLSISSRASSSKVLLNSIQCLPSRAFVFRNWTSSRSPPLLPTTPATVEYDEWFLSGCAWRR